MSTDRKNSVVAWLVLISTVLIVFLFPAWLKKPYYKEPFDDSPIQKLREDKPEFIFIGNSMLGTRIMEGKLEKLMGGREVTLLREGGSYTAHWYLKLKNYIVASGIKPKAVFIFIEGRWLMQPDMHTDGDFLKSLQLCSHADEPVIKKVLGSNKTRKQILEDTANDFYSISAQRKIIGGYLNSAAVSIAIPNEGRVLLKTLFPNLFENIISERDAQLTDFEKRRFLSDVNFKFHIEAGGLRRLPPRDTDIKEAKFDRYDFHGNVDKSFLPHIINIAKENDLNLVFVRIQTIPMKDGSIKTTVAEKKYIEALKKYLEDNECDYFDMTGDPEIGREMYMDLHHVAHEYREEYTRIFYKRLSHKLK